MMKKTILLTLLTVLISAFTVSAELNKFKVKDILVGYEANTVVGATGDEVEVFNELIRNRQRDACLAFNISPST